MPALPGSQVGSGDAGEHSEPVEIKDEKRVHPAEVKSNENAPSEETRFASDGAPGE